MVLWVLLEGNDIQPFLSFLCKGLLLGKSQLSLFFTDEYTDRNRERERQKETEEHEMKLVIGVVLLLELQKVNPRGNHGRFLQMNVFLIRLLTVGHAFFTLDASLGRVIPQLVYDWLSGCGGTMVNPAGVETEA